MHQGIIIRSAEIADAAPLSVFAAALYQERLAEMFLHDDLPSVKEEEEFIKSFTSDDCLLVAGYQKEIVGMLGFKRHRRKQLHHSGMMGMSVARDHRRNGIGSELLQGLLDWAVKDPHLCRIELDVFATNQAAIKLFENHGFLIEGTMQKAICVNGSRINNHLMARVWDKGNACTE